MKAYLQGLNDKQQEVVFSEAGRLLVLAGAGSGKTRVIISKIAYLLDQRDYAPKSILAVTFTNKASAEMQERLRNYGLFDPSMLVKTFHSFGAWFLRRYASYGGLDSNFSIYDSSDSFQLFKGLIPSGGMTPKEQKNLYYSVLAFKEQRVLGATPKEEQSPYFAEFSRLFDDYQRLLQNTSCVDFDDLILKPLQILREHPDLRESLRARFSFIVVDEYQDTNTAQFLLLKQLLGSNTQFCAVGDDDQSIYAFRGANLQHILGFAQEFQEAHIIRLEQNYRSTVSILKLADQVIAPNKNRLGKTLWTDNPPGEKPQLLLLEDYTHEALFVAQKIKQEPQLTTAILYRTNAQSRIFETIFSKEGVAYQLVGSLRFFEREEVKDALAYLTLLSNPFNKVAFLRIINKPTRGLGKTFLTLVEQKSLSHSVVNYLALLQDVVLNLKGKAKLGVESFLALFVHLQKNFSSEHTLSVLLGELLELSGLKMLYGQAEKEKKISKLANLEELSNLCASYEATSFGLSRFLETVSLESNREKESNKAHVFLVTMHNTKGLEYDRVFVTGLEEGLFPRSYNDVQEVEEERRLFYVAITRACKELYLLCARRRMINGSYAERESSSFLQCLQEEDVELVDYRMSHDFTVGPLYKGNKPYYLGKTVKNSSSNSFEKVLFPGTSCATQSEGNTGKWAVRTLVYHDDYGKGQIIKNFYSAGEEVIKVRFETGYVKEFMPKYTYLENLSYDQ